jgi:hypothetical protein
MTCYVDDMSISGRGASRRFLYEVQRVIGRHGLRSHKAHYFAPRRPKVVTGVVVTPEGVRLPNRRHKLINEQYQALVAAPGPREKMEILRTLVSRVYEAAQVDGAWLPKARALSALRRQVEAEIRADIVRQEEQDLMSIAAAAPKRARNSRTKRATATPDLASGTAPDQQMSVPLIIALNLVEPPVVSGIATAREQPAA